MKRYQKTIQSQDLEEIKGIVPSLHDLPKGCAFENRCSFAMEKCKHKSPNFEEKHLVIGHPVLRNLINEYE